MIFKRNKQKQIDFLAQITEEEKRRRAEEEIKHKGFTAHEVLLFREEVDRKVSEDILFIGFFKFLYRLSYEVGWISIFLVRVVYFTVLAIGELILSAVNAFGTRSIKEEKEGEEEDFKARVPRDLRQRVVPRKKVIGDFTRRSLKGVKDTIAGFILSWRGKKEGRREESALWADLISRGKINPLRSALSFVVLACVLVLPFQAFSFYNYLRTSDIKGEVLGISEDATRDMGKAADSISSFDLPQAATDFSEARGKFDLARDKISEINKAVLYLGRFAPDPEAKMASQADKIMEAGSISAEIGEDFSLFMKDLSYIGGNIFSTSTVDKEESKLLFSGMEERYEDITKNIRSFSVLLKDMDKKVFPEDVRGKISDIESNLKEMDPVMEDLSKFVKNVKILLGVDYDKKYLIVFQNSNEMRATGGFVGSFATVEFSKGRMENMNVPAGGSYDIDGGMRDFIVSPKPLHLVSSRWFFRDANWWPDWPTSARNLIDLYERSAGDTVDGCVAINPYVLEGLIGAIGEVDMIDEYGVVINKDNFWRIIRQSIENNKKSSAPKTIIKDLTHKIIGEIKGGLSREEALLAVESLIKGLEEKDALLYFQDSELQDMVADNGWSGEVKNAPYDYLSVVNTNIAGQKSDKSIRQVIRHRSDMALDGSVVNTVKVWRSYVGTSSEVWFRARNVDWMRIYVPQGSEILGWSGFTNLDESYFEEVADDWETGSRVENENKAIEEQDRLVKVYDEGDKTVFAGWAMLDPGESKVFEVRYRLPFVLKKKTETEEQSTWDKLLNKEDKNNYYQYSLLIQKQAGDHRTDFISDLDTGPGFSLAWGYPASVELGPDGWSAQGELDKDKIMAGILVDKE